LHRGDRGGDSQPFLPTVESRKGEAGEEPGSSHARRADARSSSGGNNDSPTTSAAHSSLFAESRARVGSEGESSYFVCTGQPGSGRTASIGSAAAEACRRRFLSAASCRFRGEARATRDEN